MNEKPRSQSMRKTIASALTVAFVAAAITIGTAGLANAAGPADNLAAGAAASSSDVAAFESHLDRSSVPQKDLAAYDALTTEQKAQFVAAASSADPVSLPGVISTPTTTITRTPVLTTGKNLLSNSLTAASAITPYYTVYNVTATWQYNMKLFGITLGYWKQIFRYQTGNAQVLTTQSCSGTFTGFSGLWAISVANERWVASGRGYCISTFTGSLVYKGSSVSSNKEMGLITDGAGIVNEYLINI